MEQEKKSGAHWKIITVVSIVMAVGLALYFVIGKVSHDTAIVELKSELIHGRNIDFAVQYVAKHDISREELTGICREVRDQAVANYGCERAMELSSLCHFEYDQLARSMDTIAVSDRVRELREGKAYPAAFNLANSCSPNYLPGGDLVRELFDYYLMTDSVSWALKLADDISYSSYISVDRYRRAREALVVQLFTYDCEKYHKCFHVEGDYLDRHLRNCESFLAACKERHVEESKSAIAMVDTQGLDMTRIMYAVTLVNSGLTIHQALELLNAKQETAKL